MGAMRKVAARALLGAGGLALAACATANTPEEKLALDRWAKCRAAYTQLERLDLDGRITFLASDSSTRQEVLDCLADASRTGPPLPPPVAVRPSGGP
jgi:hypothetical protein